MQHWQTGIRPHAHNIAGSAGPCSRHPVPNNNKAFASGYHGMSQKKIRLGTAAIFSFYNRKITSTGREPIKFVGNALTTDLVSVFETIQQTLAKFFLGHREAMPQLNFRKVLFELRSNQEVSTRRQAIGQNEFLVFAQIG
ncbi:hypothetical protein A3726_15690 [Erythrobacter sp. HI0037]|nr:hypothetical protein A3719_13405 [Erythrobacter sp. HI0020]KZY15924.1 hypothetical protein A3727_07860 [Erythrobacter sp. HI0038]KZY27824.1 hypothetical protein A3726_15690 [Erythrobacter sp. HI0037]